MLVPTLFLLGLGFGAAVILSIASKVFYVYEDPMIAEVESALLGANCGGCGYPGCSGAAQAVVEGRAAADICVAGGAEIALRVAMVMGVKIEIKEPELAFSSCSYSVNEADTKFIYLGANDCRAASMYSGGPKDCPIGCVGLGTCARACPFGAITMGDSGLPVFDQKKCRACGVCVEICPKNIIYLTSRTNRMTGDYRYDECTTPCKRACPTGIDIPAYIREISRKNYGEALRIIKEKNPLPMICGRICPAPCELECRRAYADEAVAINSLKRFVADMELDSHEKIHPYQAPATGKKAAVIGGGAQGLTVSYYLACLGHDVTLYEEQEKLGGIIRNVIPESRLPGEVIDREISGILDAGVKTETGKAFGRDITISSLLAQGLDAVVLSTGGIDSSEIMGKKTSARLIPGTYTLLEFLSTEQSARISGKKVIINGYGTSTIHAAERCVKEGATSVTIVYPYSREHAEGRKLDPAKAESAGVQFQFSRVISGMSGSGNTLGSIMVKPVDGGQEEVMPADTLIVSTGRPSDIVFSGVMDEETGGTMESAWRSVETYRVFPDSLDGDLFNLVDSIAVNDNVAVVKSIARGRKLARAVHQLLNGKEIEAQEHAITRKHDILNTRTIDNISPIHRVIMPANRGISPYDETEKLYSVIEIETGLTEEMALVESERCLECGLICYKKG